MREFAAKFRPPVESAREQKSGDRLRGALILVAMAIGCLFLFFGLFTTTTDSSKKERKTQPNLGRPQTAGTTAETANRSLVPQNCPQRCRPLTPLNPLTCEGGEASSGD